VGTLITPANFTHLEIPKKKVAEVKESLAKNGIDIPVIPLEYGEEYCRTLPFSVLVSGNPLAKK